MTVTADNARSDRFEEAYGPIVAGAHCPVERKDTLEQVVELAVEIAREGREGHKVGTIFVVGDVKRTLECSRALLLDPLYGHPPEARNVSSPEFRETVKALAQLDGAFIVDDDGTFIAAARLLDVDITSPSERLIGLGSRHAAAASITHATSANAIVVSQSAIVRVFSAGQLRAEILPELFLIARQSWHTKRANVRQLLDAGITVAVAGDNVQADAD